MSKIERLLAYTLFVTPVLWAGGSSVAPSPFDGTWRVNIDQSKLSPKPIVFSVNKGMYDCSSCVPKIHVKADGQEQAVTGQAFDTISVREVDPRSIAVTTKKGGKVVDESIRTVLNDGNTLTLKLTGHSPNSDQTFTAEETFTRVGNAPAGANGTSGSWRINKLQESDNALTATFKLAGDEFSFAQNTGSSFTAKLDGKDYPEQGSFAYNSVCLKRIDDRTIEWTSKRDGKVLRVAKVTISPDGKKMTLFATDKLTGATQTAVAEKQ